MLCALFGRVMSRRRAADLLSDDEHFNVIGAPIRAWSAICPDTTRYLSFVAGFPSETEAQFGHVMDGLREAQLDRLDCTSHSPVEGTAANPLNDEMLPDERRARFLVTQQSISNGQLHRRIDSVQRVLVNSRTPHGAPGRSMTGAPDIDGVVRSEPHCRRKRGALFDVRIESSREQAVQCAPA